MEEIQKRIQREIAESGTTEEVSYFVWEHKNGAWKKTDDLRMVLIDYKKKNHLSSAQLVGLLRYLLRTIQYSDF